MANVLNEVLLYGCLAAFVTGNRARSRELDQLSERAMSPNPLVLTRSVTPDANSWQEAIATSRVASCCALAFELAGRQHSFPHALIPVARRPTLRSRFPKTGPDGSQDVSPTQRRDSGRLLFSGQPKLS